MDSSWQHANDRKWKNFREQLVSSSQWALVFFTGGNITAIHIYLIEKTLSVKKHKLWTIRRPIGFLGRSETSSRYANTTCTLRGETLLWNVPQREIHIENQWTKPSQFKLTSAVFPESHCVALFMVFTFHPKTFLQLDIYNSDALFLSTLSPAIHFFFHIHTLSCSSSLSYDCVFLVGRGGEGGSFSLAIKIQNRIRAFLASRRSQWERYCRLSRVYRRFPLSPIAIPLFQFTAYSKHC